MEIVKSTGEKVVSVLIADSSRMATQLMATALRTSGYHVDVVGTATSSEEVRAELEKYQADIAVLSASLKDGRAAGFGLAREIRSSFPKIDVVIILDEIDREAVTQAFCAGAVGVLSRDEPFEILCKCIHVVSKGQVWANSAQLRIALDTLADTPRASAYPTPSAGDASNLLTKSETKLAYLVAEGLTNKDISRQLNLSEHTVRNYLFRIFNKLGTSNRLELALYMINRGEETPASPD
jgi:two-component system, NarL family, nitrate/nitrite response regulator NarL